MAWTWGWDALAAIGTVALAFATFALAVGTFVTARTASREIRAQWRPVIVPAAETGVGWIERDQLVVLEVRNIGEGGAFNIDPGLDLGSGIFPANRLVDGEAKPVNFAALPPGESLTLRFDNINRRPASASVVIDYSDLSGHRYGSQIEIETACYDLDESEPLLMARVRHSEGEIVVDWNDPRNYKLDRLDWLRVRLGKEPRHRS